MPDAVKYQKHTLNLYPGDYEKLRALYAEAGAAMAVRRLVRQHLEEIEKRAARPVELELEVEL